MNYCPKCKNQIPNNEDEYSKCGYLLNGSEINEPDKELNVFCPKCNERIKSGTRNCTSTLNRLQTFC